MNGAAAIIPIVNCLLSRFPASRAAGERCAVGVAGIVPVLFKETEGTRRVASLEKKQFKGSTPVGVRLRRYGFARSFRGSALLARVRAFARAEKGNVAMIFALSLIPITIAAGTGVDFSRAMIVRSRLASALDAAGLAVGASNTLSQTQLQTLAQSYFNANYTLDSSFGTPSDVTVVTGSQSATLSVSVSMPTVLMGVAGIKTLDVAFTSNIVWGQTKLWVALVLDNTGSMSETDSTGTSKIDALKTATHQLLSLLQSAAANAGDVKVSLVPFSKDVNYGTSAVSASWIDWTDWLSAPANSTPSSSVGPGSSCPYSSSSNGFRCTTGPTNGSSTASTIPSSGTYKGYICPGKDNGNVNPGRNGHYYNGCYNSVASGQTCTTNWWGKTTCTTTYTHTWIPNDTSTWGGCFMDRTQSYDEQNTTASSSNTATLFPAENASSCPPATISALSYDWTSLSNQVDAMTPNGNTNQTIGLVWGWQSMTDGDPMNSGALPDQTQRVIILLSDGLNTQNRWSQTQSDIDAREEAACDAAKADGVTIYTVFVDLNGTSGNSAALQYCASDSSKYFDLTTSSAISDAFTTIGTQITNLRVAQ